MYQANIILKSVNQRLLTDVFRASRGATIQPYTYKMKIITFKLNFHFLIGIQGQKIIV